MNHRAWRRVTTGAVITAATLMPGACVLYRFDRPFTIPALYGIAVAAAGIVAGHLGEVRTAPRKPSPRPTRHVHRTAQILREAARDTDPTPVG
jgi:hypothetical protein